jgi:hypothetical protein
MTQEEHIQPREFNATHQRTSKMRRALRLVCAAIGELAVFQEQVDCHQLPPMEEIGQFCQAVKWKDETSNICCRGGKVVFVSLHDPLQESKLLFKDPLFLTKVSSYNNILAFTSTGASLTENGRIASNGK